MIRYGSICSLSFCAGSQGDLAQMEPLLPGPTGVQKRQALAYFLKAQNTSILVDVEFDSYC